ncbi:lipase [Streptomyces sp. NPDC051172]|uniref:alpha/beta hydrolase n=1 Tax=Streptomyces sp. NPDC051172 TaxID=3155796 RepID=UPI0034372C93
MRGISAEAGRAVARLVRLPLDLAAESVEHLTGRLGSAQPSRSTADGEPSHAGSELPVMLVHGMADREWVVSSLERGLGGCGAGPFVSVTYNGFSPDIRTAARVLGEQVELTVGRCAGRPLVLIGYSLGGLVARYYVQRLGGDAHVPLVITLATPHGGTVTALLAPPHPLLRQLRPGSEVLTELARPAAVCRSRFVAFYSDLDEAVVPAARGRIDHPDLTARNVLVPGVGHLTLPLHQPVIDEVRALLTAAGRTGLRHAPARPGRDSRGKTGHAERSQ